MSTVEELQNIFREESKTERYKGILGVTKMKLSLQILLEILDATIVDLRMTKVVAGNLVKIMTWYDNEWGYTNQMIREAIKTLKN